MIFLGQASNYKGGRVLRHLFAHGNSENCRQLKVALAKRYQVERSSAYEPEEHVELYHTGRSALAAAFISVAPKGSQIIIPGLTCIAVVRAVKAAGCEPVFVDINPKTLQYDWQALDKTLKVCYNASVIVAQNTLGLPLDMTKLEQVAEKNHLEIVEDLAHCAGRFYADGREIGSVGAATALSFGKGKAIDTISGGALVVRSAKFTMPSPPQFRAKRSARWRERWYPALGTCIRAGYHIKCGKIFTAIFLKLGWIERSADAELNLNVKLSSWQAKLALQQLEQLPKTAKSSCGPLREHYFVKHRPQVLAECAAQGFYLDEIWYDTPVSPARYKKEASFPSKECPNTVKIAETIINLPTWYSEEKLAPVRKLIQPYLIESMMDDEATLRKNTESRRSEEAKK